MKLLSVVGARPQFIKLAPIVRELARRSDSGEPSPAHVTLHTGQHYDFEMSQVFFDQLGLPSPDYHLGVGSRRHGAQTAAMLRGVEDVLAQERPDVAVVYGDTNSTLAGALAAAKMHIPVAHVEAGLRSRNRRMPEELNRVIADHASDILLSPTEKAVDNLRREGFANVLNGGGLVEGSSARHAITALGPPGESPIVANVGDVMYDAMVAGLEVAEDHTTALDRLGLTPGSYIVATVHRAENADDPARLRGILTGLAELARQVEVVLPMHPRTASSSTRLDGLPFSMETPPFRVVEPVGYFDMLALQKHARAVLTDSGGMQKEAYWLGVPCVTMRSETEWEETVEAGWNVVCGTDPEDIVRAVSQWRRPADARPPALGTGQAARAIVEILTLWLAHQAEA